MGVEGNRQGQTDGGVGQVEGAHHHRIACLVPMQLVDSPIMAPV